MERARELILVVTFTVALFLIFTITLLDLVEESYRPWLITIIVVSVLAIAWVLRRRGIVPLELVAHHLPLPLALIDPPSQCSREIFEERVLPAIQAVEELTRMNAHEKAYVVIKHVREFFDKETGTSNVDAIRERLVRLGLYNDVSDTQERKNLEYSMASLIHWVARYRNLAMHSSRVDVDPIDAWFALRVALIYIDVKCSVDAAILRVRCPRCGTVNGVGLRRGETRWLQEVRFHCKKCGETRKVRVTPTLILDHYKVADQ